MICRCRPAAHQLIARGLFPCAPIHPSLAVDIQVLGFVKKLFLHFSRNVTGWCESLEDFLASKGYHINSQVCNAILRKPILPCSAENRQVFDGDSHPLSTGIRCWTCDARMPFKRKSTRNEPWQRCLRHLMHRLRRHQGLPHRQRLLLHHRSPIYQAHQLQQPQT